MCDICKMCGRPVTEDEAAMTKKLINRGTKEYMCIPCLAQYFDVSCDDIDERMAYFKEMGCMLFPCNQEKLKEKQHG